MATETTGLDLSAIEAEISKMSQEDLFKELLDIRTKQRTAALKNRNPETAKLARQKRMAKIKALMEAAKKAGILDKINEEATAKAKAAIAASAEAEVDNEADDEAAA
jgi:chromosome condensin MukBEF MukE localization factor